MQSKNKMQSGFVAILISAFFLFNPTVAFVDIFPNCIGYLLLCLGLYRLSDLCGYLNEAYRRFRIMLLLGALSLLAFYIIYAVMGKQTSEMSRYEQPVYILLAAFVSMTLQWYFLIPAFRDFFKGIDALAERHGSDALTQQKNGKSLPERMRASSTRFVVFSSVLALLPELTVLTYFEYHEENPLFPFDWYQYVELFRIACGAISFIVGLVWLIRMIRFCMIAMRDRDWVERLHAQYCADVLPQVGMLTVRRFSVAFSVLQIAMIFSINLRLNQRAVLPSVILALLVILAFRVLRGFLPRERANAGIVACAVLTIGSLLHLWLSNSYLKKFLPDASLYDPEAYHGFLLVRIADVLEVVLTFILLAVVLAYLTALAREHTEINYGAHDTRYLSADATARLHRDFQMRANVSTAIFFVAALVGAVEAWFRIEYPWLWIPSTVLSIAGIWSAWSLLYELKMQIQYRYQSDGVNKNI